MGNNSIFIVVCSSIKGTGSTFDSFQKEEDAQSFLNKILNTDFHDKVVIKLGGVYRIFPLIEGKENVEENLRDYWFNVDHEWEYRIIKEEPVRAFRNVPLNRPVFNFEPLERIRNI